MKLKLRITHWILVLCLSFYIDFCFGLRSFRNGRRMGGNLGGNPSKASNLLLSGNEDLWFTQQLDHFDPTNNLTWQQVKNETNLLLSDDSTLFFFFFIVYQRYYVNDKFYVKNGPVFLMIGGEGEATAKWMHEGAWIQYAKQFQALCFQLEHRYYGKSHPTKDLSVRNLHYLNSEQALADLAYFISSMNEKYELSPETKWVAFGGSYPGSLAAWLRERYGHLVHASISSSGPLLAKIDFTEYNDVVTASLATYSQDCVASVKSAFNQVEVLLKHMIGQKSLNEKFKLCDPVEHSVDNNLDIASLFENLADNFAGVVQYNKDNSPHATVTIDDLCEIMVNDTLGAPVTRLAAVNTLMLAKNNETCLDYKYDKMLTQMSNISWDAEASEGGRQWFYQTCTEFGFYQTSETNDALFGNRFPVEYFVRQCSDIFGENFSNDSLARGVQRTNTFYGALDPKTSNVIYVHGSIDPWHALGLTSSNNPSIPTIYINGTAHCANMYEPTEKDPPQLKEARKEIVEFISKVLQTESKGILTNEV